MDNITPRLKNVLKNAKKEAIKLGTGYIGLEHVVIATLEANSNPIEETFKRQTIPVSDIKEALRKSVTPDKKSELDDKLVVYNKELEGVLIAAKKVSDEFNHSYVGTEHTLIAIWQSGDTNVNKVFRKEKLDPESLQKILREVLDNLSKKTPPPDKITAGVGGSEEKSSNSGEPFVKKYSVDLTEKAAKGELDPVIGRTEEVARAIRILSRKKKNNPILVGPAGVGKTSIVEGLAQRIHDGSVPRVLLNKRVFALDTGLLVAGTMYRGQFEERIKKILAEAKAHKDYIIFIDEIHTIVGGGAAEGGMDMSNMFKPALARGEMNCIGATTVEEHRRYIEKDAALERRFQMVKVEEPNDKDTAAILQGAAATYGKYHGVTYDTGVVDAIVSLTNRYVNDRHQPDKGFDVLDEAGTIVKLAFTGSPEAKKELEAKIAEAKVAQSEATAKLEFEQASKIANKIKKFDFQLKKLVSDEGKTDLVVRVKHVQEVVSSWTGIPVNDLTSAEKSSLLSLEADLNKVVIAQPKATEAVAKSVKKSRTPFKNPKRPIGSFLFIGPTGVGKSLLAKTLAKKLFGTDKSFLQLDMAEYADNTAVNRLIGSSAGYVGYDDSSKLLKHMKSYPYTVILFDEIERAHPDVAQVLLAIMEDGRVTDAKGKTLDFRNTIIIMTSNAGVQAAKAMGFLSDDKKQQQVKDNMLADVKKVFKSEFLNRLEVITFNPLDSEEVLKVVALEIANLNERLAESKITIKLTKAAEKFLVKKGYDDTLGARNIRTLIETQIENALTDDFLGDKIKEKSVIIFDVADEKLRYSM